MSYTKQQIEQEIIRILEQGTAAVKKVVDAYAARRTPERDMNWLCIQMGKEFGAILLHADLGKAAIRAGMDGRDMDEKFQTIREEVAHYQGYYNLLNRTIGKDAPIPVDHIYSYVLANVGPNGLEPDGPMLAQRERWPANFNYIANMGAYTPEGEEWLNQLVEYIDGNTSFAADFVNSKLPGVKTHKPQGTYLMWLDFTECAERIGTAKMAADYNRTKPADQPALTKEQMLERHLVKNARVHLNAGHSYGSGSDHHAAIRSCTPFLGSSVPA